MAFIPAANTVRVVFDYTWDGENVVNVMHVVTPDGVTLEKMQDVAAIARGWWVNELSPALSEDIQLESVTVTDISVEDGQQTIDITGLPDTGDVASESVPNNVALCVSGHTFFTGRSNRARTYVAGLPNSAVVNNTVLTGNLGVIVDAFNEYRALLVAEGYFPVVASFVNNGVPRVTAQVHGINSYTANDRVDTQRRRLPS